MNCAIYGAVEESDIHTLFLCPLAMEIWMGSDFKDILWSGKHPYAMEALLWASERLSPDCLGVYLVIMWECWNSRNRLIFGMMDDPRSKQARRAEMFVFNFRSMKEKMEPLVKPVREQLWHPPELGILKLNFDASQLGAGNGDRGFVLQDSAREIVQGDCPRRRGRSSGVSLCTETSSSLGPPTLGSGGRLSGLNAQDSESCLP